MRKLFIWLYERGYSAGYNAALRDVALAMNGRKLKDLEWELELLRSA